MAATALITAAEYLRSSFEPDADFVDGRIEERSVGEREHSDLQRQLLLLLSQTAFQNSFVCNPELRIQVSEQRFRVPDLCLLRPDAPYESIVRTPPLLCIEILSPEDTLNRILVKARDFLDMGVPQVWIFDSRSRAAHVVSTELVVEQKDGLLTVPRTPHQVSVVEIFKILRPL